jgi:hypothetical protein
MRTLASLDSPISSLVVSPDGSTVITASNEGISYLDLTSGQRSVTPLEEEVSRLTWGPDGLLAGTLSGEVWAVGNAPARLFEAIDEEISGIAATGDGTIAVCGGEPFAVATFGPHGNEEWRGEPYKWPYCVRFSPDGKLLAVATWDGYLFVFDVHDLPDELSNLDGEHAGGPIFDARFLPGDRVLVVGASFVRIWDRGAARYTTNRELDAEAFAVAVSPDGSCAVVSTNDQRLRLFALPDLTELGQLASGSKGTKALSYFPDYAEFCHVKGPATVRTLAFHPDGTRVFGSTEDRRIVEVTRAELQRIAQPATTQLAAILPASTAPAAPASRPSAVIAATSAAAASAARRRTAADGRAAAKKGATRKLAANNTAVASPAATKAAASKAAASKLAASRAAAGKLAASRAAAGKLAASRATASKLAASKAAAPKLAASTAIASKLAASKAAAPKRPATNGGQRTSSRPSAVKLSGPKKPPANLHAGKTSSAKLSADKKTATRLPAGKKSPARKPAAKKPAARARQ